MIPTSISDGFLLALESLMRRKGQGPHLSATVLELDGPPGPAALERAADALGRRHPLLHARLKRSPFTGRAAWYPASPAPVPVASHAGLSVAGLLARLFAARPIDIFGSGANLEWHLLETPEGRHALILLWPHALFDAIGIDRLIGEIDAADPTPVAAWGETAEVSGSPGERWRRAKPMVEEMRTFPAWRIRSARRRGTAAGPPRFDVLRFDADETALIRRRMAEVAGELLLIPYFAAVSARAVCRALALRHPEAAIPALVSLPVQRVGDSAARPLFQNHMTAWSLMLAPEDLDAPLADTVKALYRKYVSFMRRKLPAAMDALVGLTHRCPSRLYLLPASLPLGGEICTLFHSHTGPLPADESVTAFGRRIVDAYHVPTVSSPPGVGVFFSESAGRLRVTLSWRETTLDPSERRALMTSLHDDLGLPPEWRERALPSPP